MALVGLEGLLSTLALVALLGLGVDGRDVWTIKYSFEPVLDRMRRARRDRKEVVGMVAAVGPYRAGLDLLALHPVTDRCALTVVKKQLDDCTFRPVPRDAPRRDLSRDREPPRGRPNHSDRHDGPRRDISRDRESHRDREPPRGRSEHRDRGDHGRGGRSSSRDRSRDGHDAGRDRRDGSRDRRDFDHREGGRRDFSGAHRRDGDRGGGKGRGRFRK